MIMRHASVAAISSVIIVNAFLYLLYRDQTFVHIDAIAHVNKARGLFDNIEPGLRQLGTVWLPFAAHPRRAAGGNRSIVAERGRGKSVARCLFCRKESVSPFDRHSI